MEQAELVREVWGEGNNTAMMAKLFEVGGESKTTRQIQDASQPAYLAVDDIVHGRGQRIPLWLFGFLY